MEHHGETLVGFNGAALGLLVLLGWGVDWGRSPTGS